MNAEPTISPIRAAAALGSREILRFVRQRNRLVGALAQPIIFWVLFSAGLGPSFRLPGNSPDAGGPSYGEYFAPGVTVLILLFTAIFATISIIEDRREGFLQSVLVAPIPRWSMVLGKLMGASIIAMFQALLFLLLGVVAGLRFSFGSGLSLTDGTLLSNAAFLGPFILLLAFGLTGLGFLIAWRTDSTQGFHAIMSVFLLPMWLLSGAFFPAQQGWLSWVLAVNPMTYGVAGMRRLLYSGVGDETATALAGLPSMGMCWLVIGAFAALMFALSCKVAGTRTTGDLL
jgi:ABC-2 type transport system permease protein